MTHDSQPRPTNAGHPQQRSGRAGWIVAWALSLALAFFVGLQVGGRQAPTAAPAPTTAPATEPGTATTAPPTPDPEVAEVLLKLPRRNPEDPLAAGRVDAPVVLTEWSDFRCPYCAQWANETLPQLQPYVDRGTLRIEYRDMAVLGEESTAVAVAARAAGQQGRFWAFYEAAFAAQAHGAKPAFDQAGLIALARTAGVPDLDRFTADLADPALRAAVQADTTEAQQFGIGGTPFFAINTEVISGAQPAATYIAAIERAAQQ